jgi:hypothetical protein
MENTEILFLFVIRIHIPLKDQCKTTFELSVLFCLNCIQFLGAYTLVTTHFRPDKFYYLVTCFFGVVTTLHFILTITNNIFISGFIYIIYVVMSYLLIFLLFPYRLSEVTDNRNMPFVNTKIFYLVICVIYIFTIILMTRSYYIIYKNLILRNLNQLENVQNNDNNNNQLPPAINASVLSYINIEMLPAPLPL